MDKTQILFVFPGQGSQIVGMGQAFADTAPERELMQEVEDALGFGLLRLMKEGPLEVLTQTENAQPALLLCGAVALRYLLRQSGKTVPELAAAVAGHSLGEYTAVHAAGGMDAPTAARLVRLRGLEMAKVKGGAMAAVLGLSPEAAAALECDGIVFANDNAAGQAVFSGFMGGFMEGAAQREAFEAAVKAAGGKRCIWLNVSGPFHTPDMRGAAAAVGGFLQATPLNPLTVPCVMNAKARMETAPDAVAAGLVAQITGRVRWRESMIAAADAGVTQVVELGVGKVLGGLAGRCDGRLAGVSLDSPAAVDAWLEAHFA